MKELEELKRKYPHSRYGQIIWNAMAAGLWEAPEANPLFAISDAELAQVLKDFEKNKKA